MSTSDTHSLRIDRWLFFTRFFKTRTLASAAVSGGHVRINGARAAPGQKVSVGDQIDLVRDRLPYRFSVEAIPARRGPAAEAQACYAEDEAVVAHRDTLRNGIRQDRMLMPRTAGRPDKHTRRQLRERNRRGGDG